MSLVTGIALAPIIDILMRVSLILTASLLLACTARRDAALRHAILVSGLAAVFLMPAAMLTVRVLPHSVVQFDLFGLVRLDGSATADVFSSHAHDEPRQQRGSLDHPGSEIFPRRGEQARRDGGRVAFVRLEESSFAHLAALWLTVLNGRLIGGGLLWAWLFGAVVRGTGLGFSLLRLRRIVARARPVTSDRALCTAGLILQQIPIRYAPRLLESAEVSAPVAAGVMGNCVLLPTGWAASSRDGEISAVLCHEFAHLARRDHRVVVLQELLASALWFHPFVHVFNRMLNRVREELCDNHAIAVVDRASYCETLLFVAGGSCVTPPRGATSMWARQWSLEDRVRGILDERRPRRTGISGVARWATVTLSLAICGLIALPQLTASQKGDRIVPPATAGSQPGSKAESLAEELTRRITKSFPVIRERMLRIENLAGRVELVPGNGPSVEVEAIVRVSELAEADAQRLIDGIRWVEVPDEDGGSRRGLSFPVDDYPTVRYPVAGETKADFDTVLYLGREVRISKSRGDSIPSVEFDLRISLPGGARVAVDNVVGPIEGESVDALLKLSTRHGVIKLGGVRAPVDANSEYGDILISRLDSDATACTGRGDIELSRVTQGHVTLSTGIGHCRIVQPPEIGFRLQYSGGRPLGAIGEGVTRIASMSGGRRSELLSRGTGGPSITVNSDSGDTVIETGP